MSSRGLGHPSMPSGAAIRLYGRRVMLRPLTAADWPQWSEVRQRNDQWLTPWEPLRPPNLLDPTRDRDAFSARCSARDRDRQAGLAYGFGVFVGAELAGEINLNGVVRGAQQGATIGYWIDRAKAGQR
ncbi:MAG: GNAT family protein, partial [Ilumatobacteraceae bacterium]